MKRGINKVILVGNLGKDPEVKYTASGAAVTNITLATSESWNDKQSGEKVEKTEWHRVVSFGRLAEIMGEYLKKGSQVYVEGKLQTRSWDDKDGNKRWTTEVVASDMLMLSKSEGAGAQKQSSESGFRKKPADKPVTGPGFADDDIPF